MMNRLKTVFRSLVLLVIFVPMMFLLTGALGLGGIPQMIRVKIIKIYSGTTLTIQDAQGNAGPVLTDVGTEIDVALDGTLTSTGRGYFGADSGALIGAATEPRAIQDPGNGAAGVAFIGAAGTQTAELRSSATEYFISTDNARSSVVPKATFGFDLETSGAKVAADATNRGSVFYEPGATGVIDRLFIETKNVADVYAWRDVCFDAFAPADAVLDITGGIRTTAGVEVGGGTSMTKVNAYTAVLDFPNTVAGAISDLNVNATGAVSGDVVDIGAPSGSVTATSTYFAWVSAADVVTIRHAPNGVAADPASGTFRVQVTKF